MDRSYLRTTEKSERLFFLALCITIISVFICLSLFQCVQTGHLDLGPIKDVNCQLNKPHYQIKLVNQCPQTVFMGTIGPNTKSPVIPAEKRWDVSSGKSISISIPPEWLSTDVRHRRGVGPRFWARTGCKHDPQTNKTKCETGDCGSQYDCVNAKLAGQAPTSIAEFCFFCGDSYTYYDVSLVDGYTISVDITPTGTFSPSRPGDPTDQFWCKTNLCNKNQDLRASCPDGFILYNKDLSMHNPSDPVNKIACFSNCGKYEYPTAPEPSCQESDSNCVNWRRFCCQASTYGKPCQQSTDCTDGGACFNGTCQCKAYYRNPPCPNNICTNQGGAAQPVAGNCQDCIGDDTVHEICPRAYTWPNDPQTYSCDAKSYTITFCPGGTNIPITPVMPIPQCSSLDSSIFDFKTAQVDCSESHGKYLCAVPRADSQNIWACDVDKVDCDGVICKW